MVPLEKLKKIQAFAHLPEKIVARLAGSMTEELYSKDETIFSEGQEGDAIYFIVQGNVLIRKTLDEKKNTYKVIALMGPGEFFGEMALLENRPRSAATLAQSDVLIYKLDRSEFNELLDGDQEGALKLFRGLVTALSARLRETTREMVAVFEVGRTLVQELDVHTLATRILGLIRNVFNDDVFGAFYYWNEFIAEYELVGTEGCWPEHLRRNRPKDDLLFRTMAIKMECIISQDWTADARFSEKARSDWQGCRSLLAAPIFGMKGPVGFMVFGHSQKTGLFVSGHRQVLAGVSNLVAPAFENAAWRQEMESKRRLERSKTVAY